MRGGEDHAGLEAAAGAEVAVELHIQREQQDERDQQLGDDPQDQVTSCLVLSCRAAGAAARRAMTPAPAVKTTVVSPSVS
jgi:hypothetical protein